jgi:segregation and condensation protein B
MRSSRLIEAVLFASDAPVRVEDLARLSEDLDEERVEEALAELRAEYETEDRAFGLFEIGAGYQILTRPEFAPVLESFETVPVSSRLSRPALETLAIIAYRQPVGRAEIEDIRGVGSGGVLRTLVEREMVEVVGRGEGLGRPLLYGTTGRFLEHFGFRTIEDLPRPEELSVVLAARDPEPEHEPEAEPETEPETEPVSRGEGDGG